MHRITPITPAELKERFRAGGELAPLDVREEGPYSKRHLLHARCLPLSRLELVLADLVPRRSVPVVVMDGGPDDQGLAERAAARLAGLGYGDVAVLEGGVEAWAAAGYEVFSGINVPSKAFGEFVEQVYDTPRLEARELHRLIHAGANMVVLDSRPFEEFQRMSIPTGVDRAGLPGARHGARSRDPGGGQLRRPDPLDHRRPVAGQRRHPKPGRSAQGRHHGLAP
jgi:rhodanese-related sulfurtransferase